ncbi:MAG: zinc ribbon domain-containing protein [Thermogemmatispora sp.]|uniref:FmdB family zinc ribbon protein n=1 Tax=Thermogemmatispora sp. TaxID=1968838 RepID=UPI002606B485|nr:FmdB family zinc ribbon protein [Thermogemmatispora sp.]MBX5455594.1 zinc ribbon domain-containing protein [Thermogemmatispora sp.]
MPTYEYACRACEHRFEIWQKITDDPLTVCPQCGGEIHRVLFPTGIVFKGHGFYKTDYTSSSSSNGASSSHSTSSKSSESESSSSSSTSEGSGSSKAPVASSSSGS